MKDINEFNEFHTKRVTDPLSPRYKIVNENNQKIEYGAVRGNKSTIKHPKDPHRVISFDLKTEDIEGARASTATEGIRKIETRKNINRIDDIPGAQTQTLKKGITTNRHVDPLRPQYQLPGHSEMPIDYSRNTRPVQLTRTAQDKPLLPTIEQKSAVTEPAEAKPKSSSSVKTNGETQKQAPLTETKPQLNDVKFYDNGVEVAGPGAQDQNERRVVTPQSGDPNRRMFASDVQPKMGRSTSANQVIATRTGSRGLVSAGSRGLVSSGSDFQKSAEKFYDTQSRGFGQKREIASAKPQGTTLETRVNHLFRIS